MAPERYGRRMGPSPSPLFEHRPEPASASPPVVLAPSRPGGQPPREYPNGRRAVWFYSRVGPLEEAVPRGPDHPDLEVLDRQAERLRWDPDARRRLRQAIAAGPRNGLIAINCRAAAIETDPGVFSWVRRFETVDGGRPRR